MQGVGRTAETGMQPAQAGVSTAVVWAHEMQGMQEQRQLQQESGAMHELPVGARTRAEARGKGG